MDLYSGLPYWIAKNPLFNYFNPLISNHTSEIVIIGSGITGALVAHELCKAGMECTMIDKRDISTGSSAASTALLQYEIDTPLCDLINFVGELPAVKAYKSCLQSITDIENVFRETGVEANFKRVPSVFYASNLSGLRRIKREYDIRKKYNLPVQFLKRKELLEKYTIKAPGALENNESAQIDTYKAATGLINYHMQNSGLKVFTHTTIEKY